MAASHASATDDQPGEAKEAISETTGATSDGPIAVTVSQIDGNSKCFHLPTESTWADLLEHVFQHFFDDSIREMNFKDDCDHSQHLTLVKLLKESELQDHTNKHWAPYGCPWRETPKLLDIGIASGSELTVVLGDPEALRDRMKYRREHYSGGFCLDDPDNIGTFGDHDGSAGIEILREAATLLDTPLAFADVTHIIADARGVPEANFTSITDRVMLDSEHRQLLMNILDEDCSDKKDFKLSITLNDLLRFLGAEQVQILTDAFPGGHFNQIKLRRCCDHGKCINFHTDVALCTMQIPLNDDDTYSGGRLMYLNSQGLHVPSRPAGSATIHDNTITHGVSVLESGVRYGLFLKKTSCFEP